MAEKSITILSCDRCGKELNSQATEEFEKDPVLRAEWMQTSLVYRHNETTESGRVHNANWQTLCESCEERVVLFFQSTRETLSQVKLSQGNDARRFLESLLAQDPQKSASILSSERQAVNALLWRMLRLAGYDDETLAKKP